MLSRWRMCVILWSTVHAIGLHAPLVSMSVKSHARSDEVDEECHAESPVEDAAYNNTPSGVDVHANVIEVIVVVIVVIVVI